MTAKRIDGKARAEQLAESITAQTATLLAEHGIKPGLAVVIIGEDPASQVYVRNKKRRAEACGFHSVQHTLPEDIAQNDVLRLIDELNNDDAIHGILVQLPLPGHLDEQTITQAILPAKDVDGFHFVNIGKLSAGHTADAFVPCTPAGCILMIEDELGPDFSGLNAVVVGRSNIVGKPMAALLLQRHATVTVCHSRTKDLPGVVRGADIVIAAVGRPDMVKGDWMMGEISLANMLDERPLRELGQYRTPIDGLYMAGSTQHPHGFITFGPGYNALQVIADDLHIDKWWARV